MSVGKASIARAVNAEKASKTETKTEVKEAEVKAAEKPSEVKAETAEKAEPKKTPGRKAGFRTKNEPGFRTQHQLYPWHHIRQVAPVYERVPLYL